MDALFSESRNTFLDFFAALEKKVVEANSALQRQHEKKTKLQEEEIRVLKEKLTKKDEIMHFHEEEINALRNQVKSLKSEKSLFEAPLQRLSPICPSCSQRDIHADQQGRKRLFSPDSSCSRSTDAPPRSSAVLPVKRRRTGPLVLVPETCPPEDSGERFDKAFCLEKTPEKETMEEVTPVKEEPSVRLGLNDLSPASVASLDVTIGPVGPSRKPLEGPKLGETMLGSECVRDSESSLPPPDSPPLLSLRSAASVARRPSLPRAARPAGRQLKLHSLTFAPKVNLARQSSRKSAGAARLQDLDETVVEGGSSDPKPPLRATRSGVRDLPTLGGSPTGPFKRPKPPVVTKTLAPTVAPRPEVLLKPEETESAPLDPIACSTLRGSSYDDTALSLASLEHSEAAESATFPATSRRPLSPLAGNGVELPAAGKPPMPPQKGFKFSDKPERRREERRQLPAFACYECEEYYRGSGLSEEEIRDRMKNCSRHRAKNPPPSTPEGFWDVDLPATPEPGSEPPEAQRKRRRKPYQFPKDLK